MNILIHTLDFALAERLVLLFVRLYTFPDRKLSLFSYSTLFLAKVQYPNT